MLDRVYLLGLQARLYEVRVLQNPLGEQQQLLLVLLVQVPLGLQVRLNTLLLAGVSKRALNGLVESRYLGFKRLDFQVGQFYVLSAVQSLLEEQGSNGSGVLTE